MRVHFDYNPRQDRLIPSQDAGMPFRAGDIIKILNQEDSFWWQVWAWQGCGWKFEAEEWLGGQCLYAVLHGMN